MELPHPIPSHLKSQQNSVPHDLNSSHQELENKVSYYLGLLLLLILKHHSQGQHICQFQ